MYAGQESHDALAFLGMLCKTNLSHDGQTSNDCVIFKTLEPMRMHWDDRVRALDKDMNRYYT